MTLAFPLSLLRFNDLLKVADAEWRISEPAQVSRLADGSILRSSIGAALWQGTFRLAPMSHNDSSEISARLSLLMRPGASFLVCPPSKLWPERDFGAVTLRRSGVVVSETPLQIRALRGFEVRGLTFDQIDDLPTIGTAYAPKIRNISTDRRELRLQDLPPNYALSTGDYLSFTYGSDPTRYALHQVVFGNTADTRGRSTDWIEVTPAIRPGAAVGAAVTLYKPRMKAIVTDVGSFGSARSGYNEGITFSFTQTLR